MSTSIFMLKIEAFTYNIKYMYFMSKHVFDALRGISMIKVLKNIYKSINKLFERMNNILLFLILLFIVFVFAEAINALVVYVNLLNNKTITSLGTFLIDFLWYPVSEKSISQVSAIVQKEYITMSINIFIAICGVLLTCITFISYLLKVRKIRRKNVIQKIEITEKGQEDIVQMEKFYKGASRITVFSSSYSWLISNNAIKTVFEELARDKSLSLCSNGECLNVKEYLSKENSEIVNCFQDVNIDIRCSFIKRNGQKYFLYRYEDSEDQSFYINIVRSHKEGQQLLEAIEKLIEAIR